MFTNQQLRLPDSPDLCVIRNLSLFMLGSWEKGRRLCIQLPRLFEKLFESPKLEKIISFNRYLTTSEQPLST